MKQFQPFFKAEGKSYNHWPVTISSETVNLFELECRLKINSHLENYN